MLTEEQKKKKKKKTVKQLLKILATLVGAILLFGCGMIVGVMSTAPAPQRVVAPAEIYVPALIPTEVNTTNEAAIPVPTATLIPTPTYLTVATIEQERGALTDIQKGQYDQDVLGKVIQFHGQVTEVTETGHVLTDEGGLFTVVCLLGIPRDSAVTLAKGQTISGMGTVAEVATFLGLRIEIQVTSWNN